MFFPVKKKQIFERIQTSHHAAGSIFSMLSSFMSCGSWWKHFYARRHFIRLENCSGRKSSTFWSRSESFECWQIQLAFKSVKRFENTREVINKIIFSFLFLALIIDSFFFHSAIVPLKKPKTLKWLFSTAFCVASTWKLLESSSVGSARRHRCWLLLLRHSFLSSSRWKAEAWCWQLANILRFSWKTSSLIFGCFLGCWSQLGFLFLLSTCFWSLELKKWVFFVQKFHNAIYLTPFIIFVDCLIFFPFIQNIF